MFLKTLIIIPIDSTSYSKTAYISAYEDISLFNPTSSQQEPTTIIFIDQPQKNPKI